MTVSELEEWLCGRRPNSIIEQSDAGYWWKGLDIKTLRIVEVQAEGKANQSKED